MNLTPLALAAAYAALRGGNKEEVPAVAPAAVPAPAPTAQIPARTDMTQMFGATQDTEDMEAGPAAEQTPSVMTKKNPSFKQAFSEARLAGDKTFQWNGKPYTTELADKTTPATKPTVPVKKKPIASAASTSKPKTPSDGLNAGEGDYGITGNVGKYNPPDAKLDSLKKSLQWIAATPAMRQQMLTNMGMDPSMAAEAPMRNPRTGREYAKGGKIQAYAKGGTVSASKRGDGIAQRGHTRGKVV